MHGYINGVEYIGREQDSSAYRDLIYKEFSTYWSEYLELQVKETQFKLVQVKGGFFFFLANDIILWKCKISSWVKRNEDFPGSTSGKEPVHQCRRHEM